MSVSAAHFKEVTNGYEKRSDGLWVHKGRADIGSARVTGPIMSPVSGQGLELLYSPAGPSSVGIVQAYDRDAAAYRDLQLYGRNVSLTPQGGTLQVPNGSINTAALAAGAVQALIGSYVALNGFATSTVNTWLATTVTTNSIACTGAMCRIECSTVIYHAVTGGAFYTGLMLDGSLLINMSYQICPGVTYSLPISWVYYYTPTATNHTFTLCVYNATAGALTINAVTNSFLYVTEQRR